jgi:hypothetical protein
MWQLTKWYEKVVYVVGWVCTILFLLGFIMGFMQEVANNNANAQELNDPILYTIQVEPMKVDLGDPSIVLYGQFQPTATPDQIQ